MAKEPAASELAEPLLPPDGDEALGDESIPVSVNNLAEVSGNIAAAVDSGSGCEGVPTLNDVSEGSGDRSAPKSRNIRLTLAYTVLAYSGRSLWSSSVLSAFVFLLCDSNPEYVGFITAVMGLFMLLASFPSGYVADRYRRDAMLKSASLVGIAAVAATCAASFAGRFDLLAAALAVWGLYWGMSDASLSALFADSMRDGDRSHYFTQRYVLVKVGALSGPAAALVMFSFLGNNWTVRDCAIVMVAGQALSLPAVIMLCFFSDDYVVPHGEGCGGGDGDGDGISSRPDRRPALSLRSSLAETQTTTVETSSSNSANGDCADGDDNEAGLDVNDDGGCYEDGSWVLIPTPRFCLCVPRNRKIPFLVGIADFTAGLAAGMSIRYFPIFFLDNLNLSPVAVQVLYTLSPVGQAALSKAAQRLSKRVGRPQTTVLFKWTGIALMVTMIAGYTHGLPVPAVCVLFFFRDSFMNSTQALNKSLLMDSVPREERGKWSALESVNMFSWSGSAAFGGGLVGREGIVFNFYATAFLQFVATLPLALLFWEVPIEEISAGAGVGARAGRRGTERRAFGER